MENIFYMALPVAMLFAILCFYLGKHKGQQIVSTQLNSFQLQNAATVEQNRSLKEKEASLEEALRECEIASQQLEKNLKDEISMRSALEGQISELVPLKATQKTNLERINELEKTNAQLSLNLDNEKKNAAEKLELVTRAREELTNHFEALCAKSLHTNNESFLQTAKQVLGNYQEAAKGDLEKRQQAIESTLKPVKDTLQSFETKISEIEKARVGAYEGLTQQVKGLLEIQSGLRSALAAPKVRGRWGEIQLRRVVELAGMLNHCDFLEQQTSDSGNFRPDLIVKLAGGKNIIVDAKAPLTAYLEAFECTDENLRSAKLKDHARQVRDHVAALSKKQYWEQFNPTPEFVVLFLPGENFYNAALEHDGALIEHGVENKVIIATPVTLISILKAIAYGWKQQSMAENAEEISGLGKELYKRILDMSEHFSDVGGKLNKAVESYNKTIGSFESRVLVSARKFKDLKVTPADQTIEFLEPVEIIPRQIQAASPQEVTE